MKIKQLALPIVLAVSFLISCNQQYPAQKQAGQDEKPDVRAPDTTRSITENSAQEAQAKTDQFAKNPFLEGRKWVLIQMNGNRVAVMRTNKPAFIKLDPASSKFTGSGSCNNIFGTYKLTGEDRISFTEMGGTRMACPDMSTETTFLEVLTNVEFFKVNESELMLFKEKDVPLAVFALVSE